MNIFDQIASRYDSPKQLKLGEIITKEVKQKLRDTKGETLLDYGCGTGLIGLELVNEFAEIIFVDPSVEMIRIVEQKIKQMKIVNAKTIADCFSEEHVLGVKADIIIVSLVLLHVPDTEDLLKELYDVLNPNGEILIVDFDKNEKINHEKVHNGFLQDELKNQFTLAGFKNITSSTFYHGEKIFMNQDATMFILRGEK
ncbi:class I SAM-dependent methyltransferase [Enterococcus quebecensis]|uniref:Methylase n=1 Tax=Enterococcus quebecensis TaxID=903983 RepID=A0A1E5GQ15_9ENTE|nr:methyltransferase domain-containing protein [Enterococcus quebecensis]OEG14794.1 methylase [Enterococcus quebecensis]OJG73896.1 hypothetical protein RV12_GL000477 [Enterococcus quebecensis]